MKAMTSNEKAAYQYPVAYKPSGFRVDVAEEENKAGCAVLFFPDETTRFRFLQTVNDVKNTHAREIKLSEVEEYTGGAYKIINQIAVLWGVTTGQKEPYFGNTYFYYLKEHLKQWNKTEEWK